MPSKTGPMPVDVVNHPPHYMANGMEAIDVMQNFSSKEEFVGHLRCTAVKYLLRLNAKGSPKVNAEKCRWYVNKLCEVLED